MTGKVDWAKCYYRKDKENLNLCPYKSFHEDYTFDNFICMPIDKKCFLLVSVNIMLANKEYFNNKINSVIINNITNHVDIWIVCENKDFRYISWNKNEFRIFKQKHQIVGQGSIVISKKFRELHGEDITFITDAYEVACKHLGVIGMVWKEKNIVQTKKNTTPDGCVCRYCKTWIYMGMPDGLDNKLTCWTCKNHRGKK